MKNKKIIWLLLVLLIGATFFYFRSSVSIVSQPTTTESQNTDIVLSNNQNYTLTATKITKVLDGKEQSMLAYNNSIPGPTFHIKQGDTVNILFKNETDEPQLLHSHGVRMNNIYDGSQMVQKEIEPGGSFTYKLTFPDPGVYWYHPHAGEVRGQALGLYGAFIVEPTTQNYWEKVNKEKVLFLSDLLMQNGNIALDPNSNALMGHYGNLMLINGQENFILNANAGEVVRLYLINSANVRPFNFKIDGAKVKLVGGDNGAYEKESFVDSILLSPSERAIVDVYFASAGTYTIQNQTPNNTYSIGKVVVDSQKVDTSYTSEWNTLHTNQYVVNDIEKYRKYTDQKPDKQLRLTIDMSMMKGGVKGGGMMNGMGNMMGISKMFAENKKEEEMVSLMGMQMTKAQAIEHCTMMPEMKGCEPYLSGRQTVDDGIEWEDNMAAMNSMMNVQNTKWKIVDEQTGKENMDINWELKKDAPVVIEIFNDPKSMHPMQHPIHFHGERFLVLERNGVKQTNLVWKDTALVKIGETVKIVLLPDNPGKWMAHCHISEHLASGMMFGFEVK